MGEAAFVDYYGLLQVSPNATAEKIAGAYRQLAASCRPENPDVADRDRLVLLNDAQQILSDPESRSAYDLNYRAKLEEPSQSSNLAVIAAGIDSESKLRMELLCLLFQLRRSNGDQPGMSLLEFEAQTSFPRERLMFTVWYLQSKGMIQRGEDSDYAITVDGVDHVEHEVKY